MNTSVNFPFSDSLRGSPETERLEERHGLVEIVNLDGGLTGQLGGGSSPLARASIREILFAYPKHGVKEGEVAVLLREL